MMTINIIARVADEEDLISELDDKNWNPQIAEIHKKNWNP